MSREKSYLQILESAAVIQENIARILEAKAKEAEVTRVWICGCLKAEQFSGGEHLHKQSIELHDNLVEVIGGVTKMENSLARNLKMLLNKEEPGGGIGDIFGAGDLS